MGQPPWHTHLPRELRSPGWSPDAVVSSLVARRSLPAAWVRRWAEAPDAPVLHDARRGWISAAQLEAESRRVARRLLGAGLVPGDRMLFSAEPSADLVIAHAGALRAGVVVVPVNTAYRAREIAHVVRDARPAAAHVDDAERASWIREAAGPAGAAGASHGGASHGGASHGGTTDGRANPARAAIVIVGPDVASPQGEDRDEGFDALLDDPDPASAAMIMYTSGTTGAPKGAVLSHANLLAGTESLLLAWRWSDTDRLVLALPLFHAHGLCVGVHGTLLAGASAVLVPRFSPAEVLDAARDHRATLFFGVPTMYHRLVQDDRVGELRRLRLCVSGSAPLPAELHARLADRAGQQVLERYGMTETLMLASNPYDGERRPGSVGIPLPGVDIRLSPDDGEILVRGPNVFGGYWENPSATAAAFADGWFRTGDVGSWDPDGYLRILGRSKELIITGGYNVYPREVEDVLLAHPAVAEVAVVGTPSDEWGETVTAYVVRAHGQDTSSEDLLAFASEQLAPYKRPRAVRFVESLPRNAMGKIQKHELD